MNHTPELTPEQQRRAAVDVAPSIDVLSDPNASLQRIQDLDIRNLALLRNQHRVIRQHLAGAQATRLQGMHRTMDAHIKALQDAQGIDPERQKALVAELSSLRSELTPTILGQSAEFVTDLLPGSAGEAARRNPDVVKAVVATGVIGLGLTALVSIWHAVSHPIQTAQNIGEGIQTSWSKFWKGVILSTVVASAAGAAAYFGMPWLKEAYEKHQKEREQNLTKLEQDIAARRAATEGPLSRFRSSTPADPQGTLMAMIPPLRKTIGEELQLLTPQNIQRFTDQAQRKRLEDRVNVLQQARKDATDVEVRLKTVPVPRPALKTNADLEAITKRLPPHPSNQPSQKQTVQNQEQNKTNPGVSRSERQPTGAADEKEHQNEKARNDARQQKLEENNKQASPSDPTPNQTPTQPNQPTLSPEQMESKRILDQIPVGVNLLNRNIEIRTGLVVKVSSNPLEIHINNIRWRLTIDTQQQTDGNSLGRFFTNAQRNVVGAAARAVLSLIQISGIQRNNEGFVFSGSFLRRRFPEQNTAAVPLETLLQHIDQINATQGNTFDVVPFMSEATRKELAGYLSDNQRLVLQRQ